MFTFTFVLFLGLGQPANFNNLASNDYRVREVAQKELGKRMNLELYLQLKNAKFKDAEATRRAEGIVKSYEEKAFPEFSFYVKIRGRKDCEHFKARCEEALLEKHTPFPENYPDYPWISVLNSKDRWNNMKGNQIYSKYIAEANKLTGLSSYCPEDYPNYRLATKLWARARIKLEMPELLKLDEKEFAKEMHFQHLVIQVDLEIMAAREEHYWKSKGKANPIWTRDGKKK